MRSFLCQQNKLIITHILCKELSERGIPFMLIYKGRQKLQ